jgi:hypothetical protein
LTDQQVHQLLWDLTTSLCDANILEVGLHKPGVDVTAPLTMDFVEANEVLVGVQVNGTCVHAKLEFDPGAHGFLLDYRIAPDWADSLQAPGRELTRLQKERDRLQLACESIVRLLLTKLKSHPLLQGMGVDVVSAQALLEWQMADYELKDGANTGEELHLAEHLLPVTLLTFPGYTGDTSHDSNHGYMLMYVAKQPDGMFTLTTVVHIAEMPRNCLKGYQIWLEHPDDPTRNLTGMFDANGVVTISNIPPGTYRLTI